MKVLFEILVSIVLHPVATVLGIINILGRDDLDGVKKVIWAVVCVVPVGPILYVTVGGGALW